jgi:hypothetical protein
VPGSRRRERDRRLVCVELLARVLLGSPRLELKR